MKNKCLFVMVFTLLSTSCNDNVLESLTDSGAGLASSDVKTKSAPTSYTSSNKDVSFGLSLKYDNGMDPAIAINTNKKVLEVHRGSLSSYQMWYHVGTTDQMRVNWGGSINYDTGCDPSVALNDNNLAVEIHRSPSQTITGKWEKSGWFRYYKTYTYYKTWYHVGVLNSNGVSWGGSINYGDGEEPDIALNNSGLCVEVHRSGNALYYRMGNVNATSKTINLGDNRQFASGYAPEVAVNNNNQVVAIYHDAGSNMYYQTGTIDTKSMTIAWGSAQYYAKGNRGDIALTNKGDVIETHVLNGELYKITGSLASNNISWQNANLFDKGFYAGKGTQDTPGVAVDCNGAMAIQAHSTRELLSTVDKSLVYSTSLYIDRMKWMEAEASNLAGKHLYEICMPGSHDAGTYNISSSSNRLKYSNGSYEKMSSLLPSIVAPFAKAQDQTILDQLKSGVRFFDLRPHYNNYNTAGDSTCFYASHGGMLGGALKDMFNDLRTFLCSTHGEVVVVRLGWFSNFDKSILNSAQSTSTQNHKALASLINYYLGDYLYKNTESSKTYGDLTYDEVTNSGTKSKVIIVHQENRYCPNNDFFSFRGITDLYSNTTDFNKMSNDQLAKMKSYRGGAGNLFLLSWTLTINFDDLGSSLSSILNMGRNLEELSSKCNTKLRNFVADNGKEYKPGILFTDYVQESGSTDCAIMLNRLK